MASQLIRCVSACTRADAEPRRGVVFDAPVAPPQGRYTTTAELLMVILKPDDGMPLSIRSADGALHFGQQRGRVVGA